MSATTTPELSVVLVTPSRGALLRGTLAHLRRQTVRDRIELILVGPDDRAFDDLDRSALAGFAGWRTVSVERIVDTEGGLAAGTPFARAPVLALLENHVYPDPGWAAAILRAHQGPWGVVGSAVDIANPATATGWVEHFLAYGFHDSTVPGGEVTRVSRNNLTFKREVISAFGERLPEVLARDGGLIAELQLAGWRCYRETAARLRHLTVSRPASMIALRLLSARASAAARARVERFSLPRRWLYVLASPVFPLLRLRALWPRLRSHPGRRGVPRFWPTLALALVLDAIGQAVGFAFGSGRSDELAGRYDLDRSRHVSAADRTRFVEAPPATLEPLDARAEGPAGS